MTAKILDGKALAAAIRNELAGEVESLVGKGVTPGLAVVLVGDDPASAIYVRNKGRAAEKLGVTAEIHRLPGDTTQSEVLALVDRLNRDSAVDGFIVQVPLPEQIDPIVVQDAISPAKDVDGFTPENIGLLAQGRPRFVAATPLGCMRLVAESGVELAGKNAVVVGRSNIVGKPMAMLLTNAHATVTVCHSRTQNLGGVVGSADVVIAAVGRAEMIRGEWIKPGAVVIDVGINRTAEGKLVGDVEFAAAVERAGAITPVPGGVGPMTIVSLLANTVVAAQLRAKPSG
ncbi:MAG: bifunctional methylenetetrahydrofolate dehydrogenase/methenyltetrahydrofolate cyclohydrolase FolD [Proteobacteria bacterium]|nr:bifunctional methylenetetrahydrofolate dehydrogenase/methenyltetrahydrofolate cyclohydrolase FolD [Pseudomonadota bacterium]